MKGPLTEPGVCQWCGYPASSAESSSCQECGNNPAKRERFKRLYRIGRTG